jgi:hypothetical protein
MRKPRLDDLEAEAATLGDGGDGDGDDDEIVAPPILMH